MNMPTNPPKIFGLSASLRNARSEEGALRLLEQLTSLPDEAALNEYLRSEARSYLDEFQAGRTARQPFDELYARIKKAGGLKGLSNSEVCLAAALWGAVSEGAEIDFQSLSVYFPASGGPRNLEDLKARIEAADAILLATPVYFGDRSSVSQMFIDLLRNDAEMRRAVEGKVYAGLAVGAKRNGGQETTLIYQMLDLLNLGMLAVGNDSVTTSQYGGTGHAGDIGQMADDREGLKTCLGTGRRVVRVAKILLAAGKCELKDDLSVGLWELQDDRQGTLASVARAAARPAPANTRFVFTEFSAESIRPCNACDICPVRVGADEEYRCLVRGEEDAMRKMHVGMLAADVIVPALYSPRDRSGLRSVYQQFMERTRYLRRGDYVFTDRLVIPFVLSDVGVNDSMHMRLITSFIRHHTVMCRPLVGLVHEGKLLNEDELRQDFALAVEQGRRLLRGRLYLAMKDPKATEYNPVGYILSSEKKIEEERMAQRQEVTQLRLQRFSQISMRRLGMSPQQSPSGHEEDGI